MPPGKQCLALTIFGLWLGAPLAASADVTITEGFESQDGYNLATQGGGSATIVSDPVHSGDQALRLGLSDGSDYAGVKLDISASNISLGQITSADYWVDQTQATDSLEHPYLVLSITTPGSDGDSTIAVMYNNPDPLHQDTWTDYVIGPDTLFQVQGDTTGLTSPDSITLAQLESSTYSDGVSWGSFAVNYVRIGAGKGDSDETPTSAYVDDLTINASSLAVPEPASMVVWALFGLALGAHRCRRRTF